MKKIYVTTIAVFVLILFNVFFIFRTVNNGNSSLSGAEADAISTLDTQAYLLPLTDIKYFPILDTNVSLPKLSAKAAAVYDLNSSRYLYSNNIDEKLPIASLTKILTAMVVIDRLNLKDIVTVSSKSMKVDSERQDLYLDERLTVEDLLRFMLIKSSNDAAYALNEHAKYLNIDLIYEMNAKAERLGTLSSHFKDPAGLEDEAYSNIEDMLKIIKAALNYPIIWQITSQKSMDIKSFDGRNHYIESTNILLEKIPGIIGGKTGYTDGAMGCMMLVLAQDDKDARIISIVLGSNERFSDTNKLVTWVREAYTWE